MNKDFYKSKTNGIKLITLWISFFIGLTGFNPKSSDKQEAAYKKRNQTVAILKNLTDTDIKISESIDIVPSNLYHSFKDKDDNTIGSYQVYSLANAFNKQNQEC